MSANVLLPWFVTVPSGLVVVMLLMAHLTNLTGEREMDATRQRIRQVNAVVMLLLVPSMVSGLSFFDWKQQPAEWVVSWSLCVILVLLMVVMAMLDTLNTARMARERHTELRDWLLGRSARNDE